MQLQNTDKMTSWEVIYTIVSVTIPDCPPPHLGKVGIVNSLPGKRER
jgi:hypothetical protein